jgi:hypothetical protein
VAARDKFNHIVYSAGGVPFLQIGEPLPSLSHFSQSLTMRRRGGFRHFAAFSRVPKIPRLSSKVLSRNFKFRSYAIHLAQIGRTFRADIAEQEHEQKVE